MQFRQGKDFNVTSEGGKHAVSLIAFSGKELSHWWWGRCIFDRDGATIPFGKIPVDYQHDPREVGCRDEKILGIRPKSSGIRWLASSVAPSGRSDLQHHYTGGEQSNRKYDCRSRYKC
jgi:hypothetical protein